MKQINGMIIQYFEWYLETKQNLWKEIQQKAQVLAKLGITAIWLPPAYKGIGGKDEVGYGVYDVYDLGEFDQKGTIPTKYGTKEEYLEAIISLKQAGIETYADIVLNHKMGADFLQTIPATKVDWGNHNLEISEKEMVKVATKYTFPGRKNKYSDFQWNWTHFDGIDYNDETKEHAIFKFKDKIWSNCVDEEYGNFDYLMGANLDFDNQEVVQECLKWGRWYLELTKVDGFRLDAIKHIDANFYKNWIQTLRREFQKELFTVGEYWSGEVSKLHHYITQTEGAISLFDVPLHYRFYQASCEPEFDWCKLLESTLVKENPSKAVTFVDNHDTQPGQALESFVKPWFKPIAYAIILLRKEGYPCIFYGDLYGIAHDGIAKVEKLEILMQLRRDKAYGTQHDYFDHYDCIGWTLEGDLEHFHSGLAVIASKAEGLEKKMYVGKEHKEEIWMDALGNQLEEVEIDEEGYGIFKTSKNSISVWIRAKEKER